MAACSRSWYSITLEWDVIGRAMLVVVLQQKKCTWRESVAAKSTSDTLGLLGISRLVLIDNGRAGCLRRLLSDICDLGHEK